MDCSLHSWITAAIPPLGQWQRTTTLSPRSRPPGEGDGSPSARRAGRWVEVARWQQSPGHQQRWLHGQLRPGGRVPRDTQGSCWREKRRQDWTVWNLMHLGMLNTGTKNLDSVPAQHKFPALTRLLLVAKLEELHGSKGRKINRNSIYITNHVLLVLLQDESHVNFSWSFKEK